MNKRKFITYTNDEINYLLSYFVRAGDVWIEWFLWWCLSGACWCVFMFMFVFVNIFLVVFVLEKKERNRKREKWIHIVLLLSVDKKYIHQLKIGVKLMCCDCLFLGWEGEKTKNTHKQVYMTKKMRVVCILLYIQYYTLNKLAETIVLICFIYCRDLNTWCGISWYDRMHNICICICVCILKITC